MKKLMNKKAFTLMEMLIVVAIIAVLVAIAIPTFTNSLEKAKQATDVANVRAAYAQMQVEYMTENTGLPSANAGKSATSAWTKDTKVESETTWKVYFPNGLNYPQNFDYKAPTADAAGTMTYTADKLDGTYTWTLAKGSQATA